MADVTKTWDMIHSERAAFVDTLEALDDDQWQAPTLCGTWSVKLLAAHVLAGAEQTGPKFMGGLARSGFRFNTMTVRDAEQLGRLAPGQIIERLRARTTTTNHPPAPLMAMLGEVVVHGQDLRRPLGLATSTPSAATVACLEMFSKANFPVGAKKRIAGLNLVATDMDWSHGAGAEVHGPGSAMLLAITGRRAGLDDLAGGGASVLASRCP